MRDRLAIIGSGEQAVLIADEAKKMNLETHSFSNDSSDRVIGHSDEHHLVSIFEIDKIVTICRKLKVGGVIATTELTIDIAAKTAQIMGLNGMSVKVSEQITDKSYVREKAKTVDKLRQPEYVVCEPGHTALMVDNFQSLLSRPP